MIFSVREIFHIHRDEHIYINVRLDKDPYYLYITLSHNHSYGDTSIESSSMLEDLPSFINSCNSLYIENVHVKMRRLIYKSLRSYIKFICTTIKVKGECKILVYPSLIPIFLSVHKRLLFDYRRLDNSNNSNSTTFIISYPNILSLS